MTLIVVPKLHVAPLLPPSLLTLSIRIHLSLYLALPALSPRRFADPTLQQRLIAATRHVLESACLAVEEGGHSRGWKSVIMGVLVCLFPVLQAIADRTGTHPKSSDYTPTPSTTRITTSSSPTQRFIFLRGRIRRRSKIQARVRLTHRYHIRR